MFTLFNLSQIVSNLIVTAGVLLLIVGLLLRFIPFVKKRMLPIIVMGALFFSVGLYNQGKLKTEKEYKLKIAELEVKLKEAEAEGQKVNTEVVTKFVTKREIIKEKGEDVIKYIDREIVKLNNICEIPNSVIQVHNLAAKNVAPENQKEENK